MVEDAEKQLPKQAGGEVVVKKEETLGEKALQFVQQVEKNVNQSFLSLQSVITNKLNTILAMGKRQAEKTDEKIGESANEVVTYTPDVDSTTLGPVAEVLADAKRANKSVLDNAVELRQKTYTKIEEAKAVILANEKNPEFKSVLKEMLVEIQFAENEYERTMEDLDEQAGQVLVDASQKLDVIAIKEAKKKVMEVAK